MLPGFDYVRPKTVQTALSHLSAEGAVAHAGGTDLIGWLRERIAPAGKVVSLSDLGGLRGIAETPEGGLRIGALTTLSELAAHPLVQKRYGGLAKAAAEVGSPQLRNQGTIGGNLCQKPRCWYYRTDFTCLRKGGGTCFAVDGENHFHAVFGGGGTCYMVHPSDTAPALIALNATVLIAGPQANRVVPLEKFFVLPEVDVGRETVLARGEIVTEIRLPASAAGIRSSYRKVRARQSWDFALVGLALALRLEGRRVTRARVVLSGVAPVPWRSTAVEQSISGRELTPEVIAAASAAATAGAEPLEKNGYKVPLVQGVVAEELARLSASA